MVSRSESESDVPSESCIRCKDRESHRECTYQHRSELDTVDAVVRVDVKQARELDPEVLLEFYSRSFSMATYETKTKDLPWYDMNLPRTKRVELSGGTGYVRLSLMVFS